MKEIQITDYKGTICIDSDIKSDKFRVVAFDSKGHVDSHYVFNPETINDCSSITYIREGGRTKFYSNDSEIYPCECDYPVSSNSLEQ